MTTFEKRTFTTEIEIDEDEEIAAANLDPRPSATQVALVRVSDSDTDGIICGYETQNGPCQRDVSERHERCWQHEDDAP